MALSLLSHFTRHHHQVLFRPCIHSLRQAPQVRFTRSKTRCFAACPITYFRGHWRLQSKQFREFKLSHFWDFVQFFTSELILPRRDPSFSSLWCQDARDIEHGLMFCLSHHLSLSSGIIRFFSGQVFIFFRQAPQVRFARYKSVIRGMPHIGAIVCVCTPLQQTVQFLSIVHV